MFVINLLARACRRPQLNLEPPKVADTHRGIGDLPPEILQDAITPFLTHKDRCCAIACCRLFKQLFEDTPAHKNFLNILPLVSGRCATIPIKNPLSLGAFSKRGEPLRFCSFDYDPRAQCVMTGDEGDYEDATVKVWNRRGEMVKQLTGRFECFDKAVISVHLDMQNGFAMASSGSSEGRVRMWDVATGEELYSEKPFGGDLSYTCADLRVGTALCGSYSGRLKLIDGAHPDREEVFAERHEGMVSWICDAPAVDRVFSCDWGKVLKIWDRTSRTCLTTLDGVCYNPEQISYEVVEKRLFVCANQRYVRELDATTGETLREYEELDQTATLKALHHDPVNKWIFAGCEFKVDALARTKILVWDRETGKLIHTFMTVEPKIATTDGVKSCYPIEQIDFDPSSKTLLTAGYGVQLWSLGGELIKRIDTGPHAQTRWDRENDLLVVFNEYRHHSNPASGTLTLFDYSKVQKPLQAAPRAEAEERKHA